MKKVLVINCGSSSLKYQLIDMETETVVAKGLAERIGIDGSRLKHQPAGKEAVIQEAPMPDHNKAVEMVLAALTDKEHGVIADMSEISAVGHRVVHGGEKFASSVVITEDVIKTMEECSELAPLHNPSAALVIRAVMKELPSVPQVVVFDTAFHQTMPAEAYIYALPEEQRTTYKIRRYGAHGTSHRFVSEEMIKLLDIPAEETKIITCHIGNGASISAVKGGKCIDTSMGFTPLDGIEMGTRCGSIDPAIVTFIMKNEGYTPDEMDNYMNKKCGFLGVTHGYSSDSRDLEKSIAENDEHKPDAVRATSVMAYQIQKYIGSYTAAMNGLDAVVFTAGMGENNPELRERVCTGMEYFGIKLNKDVNAVTHHQSKTVELSASDSKVKIYLIPTNEELMIARDTENIVSSL